MTSKKVKIVKVPLPEEQKTKSIPQNFPNMPVMYLELMENKSKIKPDQVNKEYIPKASKDEGANLQFDDEHESQKSPSRSPSPSPSSSVQDSEHFSDDINSPSPTSPSKLDFNSDLQSPSPSVKSKSPSRASSPTPSRSKSISQSRSRSRSPSRSPSRSRSKSISQSRSRSMSSKKDEREHDSKIKHRLKQLLEESDNESELEQKNDRDTYTAPTLKELEEKGKFQRKKEVEDIGHPSVSQQEEEDAKRELLFKFDLLKKSYRTDNVPEFTIHSDYHHMKKTYETTLRSLSLDKSVEDYKRYLIGGFMLMEFVCGNWLGFDMSGFTQQQMVSMNSYEKLLIELGEKSYVPSGSKWPVEVRLLFLVIMNAAFFIISKMIMKRTGSNLMGMMNNMSQTMNAAAESLPKKRKMRGPTISVDDIPDIASEN